MITQEIPISLLMEPQKNLIFRKGDFGNQIKIKFPDLTGITSAEFRLIKPDDTFVVSSGEIFGNDILITITDQMSVKSGLCIFNLRLINNSSNIYTYVGRALIDDNINLDDYAESVAEVNGLVFPDDFLTDEDIPDLSTYATKEYVNEAIAEIPIYTPPAYSLEEQDTGLKWIDGKHIYQKTIDFGNLPDNDTKTVSTGVSDIDALISMEGVVKWPSGYQATIDSNNTLEAMYVFVLDPTGAISCSTSMDRSNLTAIVTIKYTKTTDTI